MPWENPRSISGRELYDPAERERVGTPELTVNSDPIRRLALVFSAEAKAFGSMNGTANLSNREINEILQRAFDALVAEVAIYDARGSLVVSNEAWRSKEQSSDGPKLHDPTNARTENPPFKA